MKYIVKDIESYQRAISIAWALPAKKGEKEVRLSLTGNTLTITTMGGGSVMHSSVEVVGASNGEAWVDGTQLENVSSLLPSGRELTVSLGQALTYQVVGYSAQDIVLAATHPTIPSLGDGEEVFRGVDLTDLNCKDTKALVTISLKDYALVLNTKGSGALMRVVIPTAYPCPKPFSTEVTIHILTFMRKMKNASIYVYPTGYMALSDGEVELIVPITASRSEGSPIDMVSTLPTAYTIKVEQQDLLSALNWSSLSAPTAVTLGYTDPMPFIEIKADGAKAPTKVGFTQAEVDPEDNPSTDEVTLVMEEARYAPTTFLAALNALPKGPITLTGKSLPAQGSNPPMPVLLLTHNGNSTIDVLLNALA